MLHELLFCGRGLVRLGLCGWFVLLLGVSALTVRGQTSSPPTTVYIDSGQLGQITAGNAAMLTAFNTFAADSSAQAVANYNAVSGLLNYFNAAAGANTATIGQLQNATATFASVATALTSGNWAQLNNNLVAYNASLNGMNSAIGANTGGMTNAMNSVAVAMGAIPAQMTAAVNAVITLALNGVMAANSNLANSTNLANLAGLSALTNLAGVIVLTNISSQLTDINTSLLGMTNLGLSSGDIQEMADAIGASSTNASLMAAYVMTNAFGKQIQVLTNADYWVKVAATNSEYLKDSTNWFRLMLDELLKNSAGLAWNTNLLYQMKGQGDDAATKRTEFKALFERLVEIQTTNTARVNVNVTNYPNFNSEAAAALGIAGHNESAAQRLMVMNGNYANSNTIPSPVPFAIIGAGVAPLIPAAASDAFVLTAEIPGHGPVVFDFNPMRSRFAPVITAFRVALIWVFTLAFLWKCLQLAEGSAFMVLASQQMRLPSASVAGFSVGYLAAPVFIGVYVAAALIYCVGVIAVFDNVSNLSVILGSNPFAAFVGTNLDDGLWLANQFFPLALLTGQAVWLLTSRFSLFGIGWAFQVVNKFLVT